MSNNRIILEGCLSQFKTANEIDLKDKYGDEIDDFFLNIKLKIIEKTKNNL